jgi:hypothetical protein
VLTTLLDVPPLEWLVEVQFIEILIDAVMYFIAPVDEES